MRAPKFEKSVKTFSRMQQHQLSEDFSKALILVFEVPICWTVFLILEHCVHFLCIVIISGRMGIYLKPGFLVPAVVPYFYHI